MGDSAVFRYGSFRLVRVSTKDGPLVIEIQFEKEKGVPYELRFTKDEVSRIKKCIKQSKP